jgi:hypothetical protein
MLPFLRWSLSGMFMSQDFLLDSHYRPSWLNSPVKIEHRKNEVMLLQENRSERLNTAVDLWRTCYVLEQKGRTSRHSTPTYYKVGSGLFCSFLLCLSYRRWISKHVFLIVQYKPGLLTRFEVLVASRLRWATTYCYRRCSNGTGMGNCLYSGAGFGDFKKPWVVVIKCLYLQECKYIHRATQLGVRRTFPKCFHAIFRTSMTSMFIYCRC